MRSHTSRSTRGLSPRPPCVRSCAEELCRQRKCAGACSWSGRMKVTSDNIRCGRAFAAVVAPTEIVAPLSARAKSLRLQSSRGEPARSSRAESGLGCRRCAVSPALFAFARSMEGLYRRPVVYTSDRPSASWGRRASSSYSSEHPFSHLDAHLHRTRSLQCCR